MTVPIIKSSLEMQILWKDIKDYVSEYGDLAIYKKMRIMELLQECYNAGLPNINWQWLKDNENLCSFDYVIFGEETNKCE